MRLQGIQFNDKQLYFLALIDIFIKFNKGLFEVSQLPLSPLLCRVANY